MSQMEILNVAMNYQKWLFMILFLDFLSFTNIKQNVVLEVANQLEEISME